MDNTKHTITNKDTKKATCISCHWEMERHTCDNCFYCLYDSCTRFGLLTVVAITEIVEEDKPDYKMPGYDETMDLLDKLTIKPKETPDQKLHKTVIPMSKKNYDRYVELLTTNTKLEKEI